MSVLYIMLPAALLIASAAVIGFIVAARNGQYDDLDTPAYRVLPDDDGVRVSGLDETEINGAVGNRTPVPNSL